MKGTVGHDLYDTLLLYGGGFVSVNLYGTGWKLQNKNPFIVCNHCHPAPFLYSPYLQRGPTPTPPFPYTGEMLDDWIGHTPGYKLQNGQDCQPTTVKAQLTQTSSFTEICIVYHNIISTQNTLFICLLYKYLVWDMEGKKCLPPFLCLPHFPAPFFSSPLSCPFSKSSPPPHYAIHR